MWLVCLDRETVREGLEQGLGARLLVRVRMIMGCPMVLMMMMNVERCEIYCKKTLSGVN